MWSTLPLVLVPILSLASLILARPYTNPILPGWHSDPSCTLANDTIFCTTSTFLAYPGFPIYASKDLLHWQLASNAFNRESQIPVLHDIPSSTTTGGNFAPTLRYRNGVFYLITTFFIQIDDQVELKGLVFRSTDPWSDDAWSEPVEFPVIGIDPDIFWDDHDNTPNGNDELVYVTSTNSHQIQHYALNLTTGQTGPPTPLWNGTGGQNPEGSHLYKRDNYYYLLLAEGGTELGHASTIARSTSRTGPWEASPHNPLLTNRNTTQFFQTVGHADLFADGEGTWWAVALGTRSGAEWRVYPMGRETVLTAVEWGEDGWPVARAVRGVMEGDLPNTGEDGLNGKGEGGVDDPDKVDFEPGSVIPKHFVHWRYPKKDAFAVSAADSGHANTLRLAPSVSNLTGNASSSSEDGITFIARRQTDTLFTYSVDLLFTPKGVHEEAGVAVFLTQAQHIDLGVVSLPSSSQKKPELALRFRVQGRGNLKGPLPESNTMPIPESWKETIRLQIQAVNATHYAFSASPASSGQGERIVLGYAEAAIVSGGTGPYTGEYLPLYSICLEVNVCID